jgi:acyl-CoA synthetase (AMP-forming)/AMP-acid ligase II
MSEWLIQRFSEYGERPCLPGNAGTVNYAKLRDRIETYSQELEQAGVAAGHVVALIGDYSLSGIAALLALFRIKAIVAPIALASADETERRLHEAQANWKLQAGPRLKLTPIEPTGPLHPYIEQLGAQHSAGLILFSSGSTGRPKAMIHDADRLLASFQKKRARKHRILIFLLFDHIGGLNTLFNALSTGALIVVPESREANTVAEAIERYKVNLLPASPTFLNLLLMSGAAQKYDLSSLRFITYGTEPMPESLLNRIKDALPDVSLIQTFGTSETGISQTVSRASNSTLIKFDDPNSEYKIEAGELWIRSKNQVLGYLNHSMERFTADGWFRTGDLVEEAADGFIKIIGRREDLINVGGEKVTPSEVESRLLEIPEVMDCLVYGEDNAITGQIVAAQIVIAQDQDLKLLKRIIKKHCRAKLSPYKVPARITFCDQTAFNTRFKKMRHTATP